MKKPTRKTRALFFFFVSSRPSLLSSHVLITLFGSATQRHTTVSGRVGKSLVHCYPLKCAVRSMGYWVEGITNKD